MREADNSERPCEPGGNYGLCKTHPTCEMIRKRLQEALADAAAAESQLETLRAELGPRLAAANSVRIAVKACARCGEAHEPIWFDVLPGQPNPHYSHWAECPTTGHPILMRIALDPGEGMTPEPPAR